MSAGDPIKVSPQQLLEQQSLPEFELALRPWLIHWVQEGQDYGRDGFVQIIDESPAGGTVSPLTLFIQAKSQRGALSAASTVTIETRHLANWIGGPSSVLLALWGASDRRIAFRTARQVAAELDRTNAGWKQQVTVTVPFRDEHLMTGKRARDCIRGWVADESDTLGGVKRFHHTRRRVLLTDLYQGTCLTSQTITAAAPGKKDYQILLGCGWQDAELDPADVFAPRVLSGALLLFDEVLIPLSFFEVVLKVLGPELLLTLLTSEHLVPVTTEGIVGFQNVDGALRGIPVAMAPLHIRGPREVAEKVVRSVREMPELVDAIQRATRVIPTRVSDSILRETEKDLAKPALRKLLGLSNYRSSDNSEPVWDARLVNRLLHLNTAFATAEHLSVDVVEYEAGLSRLATEKWYTELRFNRLFSSVEAFDAVFRSAGVPDLGLLEEHVGLAAIATLAMGTQAQEFRDWFWESVCGMAESGSELEARVISQLQRMVGEDLRSIRLPSALKLHFVDQLRFDYLVGPSEYSGRHGYASRSVRGIAAIRRQGAIQARHRLQTIGARFGRPSPYDVCPCRSGAKFRFCCGRRL